MSSSSTASRPPGAMAFGLLFIQFVLIWATFFILSAAVNWPQSLDDPASVALPRLVEQRTPVLIGYACYMLAALLLIPAAAGLNARLRPDPSVAGLSLALATVAAIAKMIGIGRWLFAMPDLAAAYVLPGSDRDTIGLIFATLNAYAGGIGEVIGVGLVGGTWTLLIGALVWASGEPWSKVTGGLAVLCGASLFLTIPAASGVDLGPVLTISNIAWQFSLLGVAFWCLRRPKSHNGGLHHV